MFTDVVHILRLFFFGLSSGDLLNGRMREVAVDVKIGDRGSVTAACPLRCSWSAAVVAGEGDDAARLLLESRCAVDGIFGTYACGDEKKPPTAALRATFERPHSLE